MDTILHAFFTDTAPFFVQLSFHWAPDRFHVLLHAIAVAMCCRLREVNTALLGFTQHH